MFAFETGIAPGRTYHGFAARAAVAALFATLGGCASDQYQSPTPYARTNVAAAQTVIDVEDDGLPAQTPPSRGTRYAPDDPAEPFSRNYGGVNPSASGVPAAPVPEHSRVPTPDIPDDLPPAFRRQLVTAMTADE